ncbi:hypothetical protein LTR36_007369 [Oleoguttula mirabilis]|uniref:DNA mismatch repair protein PMS1 n=1 Tax=Oleoguttula mirabilis TaxID=1507867 RepID=A0AAV9J9R2_9PEZI|nr:hypothetical protein LTR36_007369 [Oleoguttula mirabilis]
MATIKAIEGRSVHQIQSGQVIVDLNSVVKELVENSLDAGATSIEVRFKTQGLDTIEVQDNGKGIPPDDYGTVALKHYTSKLSDYEDLTSLDTFGFRGEALSSLCALSKFHILTARAEDGAVGQRLDFEISGQLKGTTVAAAQKGTTVSVDELFHNLPVRRKELEKNIKREYGKVIGLLHAYACISVGVRFSVSNQMPKGKKVAVFSTKSNTTTKENIVNVFGAKTLLALIKLDLNLEMAPSTGPSTQGARNWSTQATDQSMEVQVLGHISKPVFGEGRQAPDRQMFFVNSRPCALPQVSKAVNEVYKSFNVTQSPFIFANLVMDTNAYDVNVSPDKRTIMLHDQTALLERLKAALTELFEHTDHTVPQSSLPNKKLPAYQPLTVPRQRSFAGASVLAEESADAGEEESDEETEAVDGPSLTAERAASGIAKATQPSLIHNWIGRDTQRRSETPAPRKPSVTLSKDKQKLVKAMQGQGQSEPEISGNDLVDAEKTTLAKEDQLVDTFDDGAAPSRLDQVTAADQPTDGTDEAESQPAPELEPNPMSTSYDDLFSQRPTSFTKALFPQPTAPRGDMRPPDGETLSAPNETPQSEAASDITAIAPSSQKATPGPVANAFDRMRPMRTPLQTAEITVGDTTTTTVFGSSPAFKRRRIHAPQNSQAIAKFGASPLLARGLRNFAAPGSQMAMDCSDIPPDNIKDVAEVSHEDDLDDSDEDESASEVETDQNEAVGSHIIAAAADETDDRTSDPLDDLTPAPADDDDYDENYTDEREERIREDEKVARLIQDAQEAAARPTNDNLQRASQVLKHGGNRKKSTLQLMRMLSTSVMDIEKGAASLHSSMRAYAKACGDEDNAVVKGELDDSNAENKLSLTVAKSDFERMIVIGQFNLGFILAIRPAVNEQDRDELFIIDQHAADEKYNYERLQRTVTLQSQRLVRPKPLELTAIEEEVILNNPDALKANGFEIETTHSITEDDHDGDDDETPAVGRRCRLLTLPISGDKTFELSDLDELLHLLSEAPAGGSEIPRPKKVQRMLAMRACRSSIMVGKTLTVKQMRKVVGHMGEMEKPWNCPHGRPTMRHLAGLGAWKGWQEGDVVDGDEMGGRRETDWKDWLARGR